MEKYYLIIFVISSIFAPVFPQENSTEVSETSDRKFSTCADSSQCNLSEGFMCKDSKCVCAYAALKFDPETRKCMAKIGGQCGFFIGSSNATMAPCPENSMCVWDNDAFKASYQYAEKHCVCMIGYYKDDTGGCIAYSKFDETCAGNKKCDFESDLVCSSTTSTCQCPFGDDQYYDKELRKCISFVNGNCSMYCVDNAFCENYSPEMSINPKRWSNPESSNTEYIRETICQCRPGYEPTNDRRCKLIPPGFNSPCYGEDEQCDTKKNLECIDKICQCMNPLHQTYSFELGKCIGMVGNICDQERKDNCVTNAECTMGEETGNPICKCVEGYSTTPTKKCMKGFGQECYNEFCNVFAGLSCKNRTCSCYDSFLKYDEENAKCVSSVGAPCGKMYMPMELDDYAMSAHTSSMRNPFMTNSVRAQYMNMKALCLECDGYHISCPKGSVCVSDTDILVVARGKETRKCRVPAT